MNKGGAYVRAGVAACPLFFFLIHRSHSISFTRAQGIPKYKIGFGRGERMGELGKYWLRGGGGGVTALTGPVTGELPSSG